MKDRIPKYPGRVRLVPVPGKENTYDMIRADEAEQIGTPLIKANLLDDVASSLFKLDPMTSTPSEAFQFLGEFNRHWWEKYTAAAAEKPKQSGVKIIQYDGNTSVEILTSNKEPTIDYDDKLVFEWQAKMVEKKNVASVLNASKYFMFPNESKYFSSALFYRRPYRSFSDAVFIPSSAGDNRDIIQGSCAELYTRKGAPQYIQSGNKSDYPPNGVLDGIHYRYLGIPFENIPVAPKIRYGTYTGTGKSGPSNPSIIYTNFKPLFIFVGRQLFNGSYRLYAVRGCTEAIGSEGAHYQSGITIRWGWDNVEWHAGENLDEEQLNIAGEMYSYIVIGEGQIS